MSAKPLGALGLPRPLMRGPDFGFQPDGLLLARRRWAFTPGVIAAFGYSQQSAQDHRRVLMSQLLYLCVFHRDSFAKYAAHFFSRSRSSLTSANSLRSRANSISVSVGNRCP